MAAGPAAVEVAYLVRRKHVIRLIDSLNDVGRHLFHHLSHALDRHAVQEVRETAGDLQDEAGFSGGVLGGEGGVG